MNNSFEATIKVVVCEDGSKRTVYGLMSASENDAVYADDIFESECEAQAFAKLCTESGLSREHFFEVIDDLLASK